MTTTSPSSTRRGLAITSLVLGAVASLMILGYWLIGGSSDQGLTNAVVLAVLFFYASVIVGAVAVILGIAAVIFSRPRLFGAIAIVLGAVPVVAVLVALAAQAG
ncbi:MAG: hypothetical protein WAK00_15900 [Microbacterium sp.]|uniref:hypothetical protein n=1 Tax=Microbacterium sp. TaxID=51671 RepID=UPI003BB05259